MTAPPSPYPSQNPPKNAFLQHPNSIPEDTMNPMKACPRYDTCSAPICPLDPNWCRSSHLPGERVCVWLTEPSKPGGEERIRSRLAEPIADRVVPVYPRIREHGGANLRYTLDRASRTGSKLEQEHRAGARLKSLAHVAKRVSQSVERSPTLG